MYNILITGGHGFVGTNLVNYFLSDLKHLLFIPTKSELNLLDGVDNIYNYLQFHQIDTIIHLAATVAGLPGNIGNQGLFMYESLQMGMNIFEAARKYKITKLINLSTVCGYHAIGPKPFKEENYWNGLPHESNRGYGMAKRTLVMLGIEYERQYGMNITNLIPINLVGPYDQSDHVIMDIIKKFESVKRSNDDKIILWCKGSATREFVDVLDLCRAINYSLNIKTDAWPINIGTGREISIYDLAYMIKRIGGYNVVIEWDDTKPEGQSSRQLDINKAKNILGWEPSIKLEDSIKRTIHWYKEKLSEER